MMESARVNSNPAVNHADPELGHLTNTSEKSRSSDEADASATTNVSESEQKDNEHSVASNGQDSNKDPNIVFWDGPDDPENPMNWPMKSKFTNVAIVSTWTLLTPLASSMVAPGIGDVLKTFRSTDLTLGSFVVSIFVLGYAVGPLAVAPMSELYGRMPIYHTMNILFVIWTLACSFAPSLNSLLAFRFFEGMAGVCAITIGSGTISDLIPAAQRGAFMSVYSLGPLLGPVIGPVAGAFLSEKEGWRWVFRVLTIASAVMTGVTFIFLRESYGPVVLESRVKRLRKETGNQQLRSKLDKGLRPRQVFTMAIFRPTKMLFLSPIVLLLSLYMAVIYGYLYLLFTTITRLFEEDYGFSAGTAGLSYLGIGIGMFMGLFIFGGTSDKTVTMLTERYGGGERKPEYRLPPMMVGSAMIPIGLFWYGWSAQARVHWIMPIIGTGWVGAGLIATFMPIATYLVDAYTVYAASAMAGNTVLRSLVGAFLPLAGPALYRKLGLGWGNSLLAFIAIALWPMSLFFYVYGERLRTSKRFKIEF